MAESEFRELNSENSLDRNRIQQYISTMQKQDNSQLDSSLQHLEELAARFDAAILVDKDGCYALQERRYDEEGKLIVQYRPDPCWFFELDDWMKFSESYPEDYIC